MYILKTILLLAVFFCFTPKALATEAEETCGGDSTLIYSSTDIDLTICHAPYTKINRSQLGRWQDCNDSIIQITDKKQAKTLRYADCGLTGKKQFMVRGNVFMLRHFYTEYPGFEMKPLLIETFDLATGRKKYELLKKFSTKGNKDIDDAIRRIDAAIAKRFDGNTFLTAVYDGIFKLRDCATTHYRLVLSTLEKYAQTGAFDGEAAETLSEVIDEVELIAAATKRQK